MIWIAVIIEVVKAATTGKCGNQLPPSLFRPVPDDACTDRFSAGDGWEDFGVLLVLQILNGCVGW